MVTQVDLDKMNALTSELRQISEALDIFAVNGRIVNLTVSTPVSEFQARSVLVQTASMAYPSQMVEAIKDYLDQRVQAIRDELAALGMTEVDAVAPAEPRKSGERK